MPKIRRWFPVSHDINADPQVWALTSKCGDRSLRVWLELLSISDRNDGYLPPMSHTLARALAGRCQVSAKTVTKVWDYATAWLWIVSDPTPRVAKYRDYHKTRETKQIPPGEQTGSPPSEPSLPSLPKEIHKNVSSSVLLKQEPSDAWDASMFYVRDFLQNGAPPLTNPQLILDNDWWVDVFDAVNGFDLAFLKKEFAVMSAWLQEHPRRRPLPNSKSVKTFVRGWLTRSKEKERRYAQKA